MVVQMYIADDPQLATEMSETSRVQGRSEYYEDDPFEEVDECLFKSGKLQEGACDERLEQQHSTAVAAAQESLRKAMENHARRKKKRQKMSETLRQANSKAKPQNTDVVPVVTTCEARGNPGSVRKRVEFQDHEPVCVCVEEVFRD